MGCDETSPLSQVVIQSTRDQRTLDFLVETCGVAAVESACRQVPAGRRLYVSNLARVLKITIPERVIATPRVEGAARMAEIKELLRVRVTRRGG